MFSLPKTIKVDKEKRKAKLLLERTIRYCQGYVLDGHLEVERHYNDPNPYIIIRVILDPNKKLRLVPVVGNWGEELETPF
jgi:GH15 family glucan-1,4-alpha-glucosidase